MSMSFFSNSTQQNKAKQKTQKNKPKKNKKRKNIYSDCVQKTTTVVFVQHFLQHEDRGRTDDHLTPAMQYFSYIQETIESYSGCFLEKKLNLSVFKHPSILWMIVVVKIFVGIKSVYVCYLNHWTYLNNHWLHQNVHKNGHTVNSNTFKLPQNIQDQV